jgi:hypothetical protein
VDFGLRGCREQFKRWHCGTWVFLKQAADFTLLNTVIRISSPPPPRFPMGPRKNLTWIEGFENLISTVHRGVLGGDMRGSASPVCMTHQVRTRFQASEDS